MNVQYISIFNFSYFLELLSFPRSHKNLEGVKGLSKNLYSLS